ncbi:MAG: GNAT family N-acetyltransferase [Varibaculum sp.]|nr:GNAT family N-acetyltransferase [Varibaculum sp.]
MQDKQGNEIRVGLMPKYSAYIVAYEGEEHPAGVASFYDAPTGERIFYHTEIAPRYEGRGLASALVSEALRLTSADGVTVVASCPVVHGWLEKHPEFAGEWRIPTPEDIRALQHGLGLGSGH